MIVKKGNFKTMLNNSPLSITIGNFDGVHLGHRKLIEKTKSFTSTSSAVLTFNPHPRILFNDHNFKKLMDVEDKINTIELLDIDYMFIVDFVKEFSNLSPLEFINFLKQLNVINIVVGSDYRFGKKASGSIEDLKQHFNVVVVDDLKYNNKRISSSYIKSLLNDKKIEEVNKLLTKPYKITAKVISGNKVGRTLGFPTANLDVNNFKLPAKGVYFVKTIVENKEYLGLLNIGNNPTINFSKTLKAEMYILDFNKDIYNKVITISFYKYLRDEKKFNNKDELIRQINKDIINVKTLYYKGE